LDGYLAHRHKLVIGGNHDFFFLKFPKEAKWFVKNTNYINDDGTTIEGLRSWDPPIHPCFTIGRFTANMAKTFANTGISLQQTQIFSLRNSHFSAFGTPQIKVKWVVRIY